MLNSFHLILLFQVLGLNHHMKLIHLTPGFLCLMASTFFQQKYYQDICTKLRKNKVYFYFEKTISHSFFDTGRGSLFVQFTKLNFVDKRWLPICLCHVLKAKLCNQVPSLSLSRWRTLTLLKI